MKIYLGTDHAGFTLKEKIKPYLLDQGFEVEDCGAFELNYDDDYPDFVSKVALKTAKDNSSFGIVFGKSGAGECIVANKIKKIRAILGFSAENVRLAREHNNVNILSLGSEFVDEELAKKLVMIFLKTPFTNEERHVRRLKKITLIENENLI
ncbi:MAG: RpiB/LacA/LacB family sugar-phosphate isomerase [Candidatus Levybacteria bacterium]|nr:RpiB/LacA/LacB family sugar-phosphate isomerase [Candidatus Levybacteria bacterium]